MSIVKWADRDSFPTMSNLFDGFFNTGEGLFKELSQGKTVPAVNVVETDTNFELELAVPGKSKDDFKIELDNSVLTISSENEEEKESEGKNYTRKEYSYSAFKRSFTLPENAKESDVQATYDNGILKISIPKTETSEPNPKSIPVQ